MDSMKIIVDNWPSTPWHEIWIPIGIALLALTISLISLYFTRKEFVKSSRPYVWASNLGIWDNTNMKKISILEAVACRVTNSPARIIKMELQISLDKKKLFSETIENVVRFPDIRSEWNFGIGKKEFEKIMSRSNKDRARLTRDVSIVYSSLDGGKIYHFTLNQFFNTTVDDWKDIKQSAD